MDFGKTAFIFPGQGSQAAGMGKDIAEVYPIAKETFEEADSMIGFGLSKLMFDGTDADSPGLGGDGQARREGPRGVLGEGSRGVGVVPQVGTRAGR